MKFRNNAMFVQSTLKWVNNGALIINSAFLEKSTKLGSFMWRAKVL